MKKGVRLGVLPLAIVLAAFFAVLPRTGADATVKLLPGAQGPRFSPSLVRVQPGDRVAFENRTDRTQTASCIDCPWTSGDIQPGQTVFVTLPDQGSYGYHSAYDQTLTGRVVVGNVEP